MNYCLNLSLLPQSLSVTNSVLENVWTVELILICCLYVSVCCLPSPTPVRTQALQRRGPR